LRLPATLAQKIGVFVRAYLAIETAVAALGSASCALAAYLAVFSVDRFSDTPASVRGGLLACVLGAGAALWIRWWRRWKMGGDPRSAARLIQNKIPALGDRLLGAVEIAQGRIENGRMSLEICRAALDQIASEAQRHDFGRIADRRPALRLAACAGALAACAVACGAFMPEAALNALKRTCLPWAGIERFTFVVLEPVPPVIAVARGEPFSVTARVSRLSRRRPASAFLEIEGGQRIAGSIRNGEIVFDCPPRVKEVRARLRAGDAARDFRIEPMLRPEITGLWVVEKYPGYLDRPAMRRRIGGSALSVVRGSIVAFAGECSRELESVEILQPQGAKAELSSNSFEIAAVEAESLTNGLTFRWTDRLGLSGSRPLSLTVSVVDDEPPSAECEGLERAMALLPEEVVRFTVAAQDDQRIAEAGIRWTVLSGPASNAPVERIEVLARGTGEVRSLSVPVEFSPLEVGAAEESTVRIEAWAADNFPERGRVFSAPHRLYVLSRARHARMLMDKLEQVQGRLEDMAREEERLADQHRGIATADQQTVDSEQTESALRENAAAEEINADQARRLSSDIESLLKEGLKNPEIAENMLTAWADLSQRLEQVAKDMMLEASAELRKAASGAGGRREKASSAADLERRAAEELRSMEEKANRSAERMAARSFVNRLRAAAAEERAVSEEMKSVLSESVGLKPEQLGEELKKSIEASAHRQDAVKDEAISLQEDLAGFFNRTRMEAYEAVRRDMIGRKTADSLAALAAAVRRNLAGQAIGEAAAWAGQFDEWAEWLAHRNESGEGGGEGGEGADERDLEALAALIRARVMEEALREQTRVLERSKDGNPMYGEAARRLARKQDEIARDVSRIERAAENPSLRKLAEKVSGEMMNAVMYLKRPQTDADTIAIETLIIELLAEGEDSCSGGGRSGAAAALRRLGGRGAGSRGGGSSSGGSTDRGNETADGARAGEISVERRGAGVSGALDADWPEEFREEIEAYFRAMEGEEAVK